MLRQKKNLHGRIYDRNVYMHNYQQQGILWTQGIATKAENIANKIPLVNDFLKFKFLEDIQASILQAKPILKLHHR